LKSALHDGLLRVKSESATDLHAGRLQGLESDPEASATPFQVKATRVLTSAVRDGRMQVGLESIASLARQDCPASSSKIDLENSNAKASQDRGRRAPRGAFPDESLTEVLSTTRREDFKEDLAAIAATTRLEVPGAMDVLEDSGEMVDRLSERVLQNSHDHGDGGEVSTSEVQARESIVISSDQVELLSAFDEAKEACTVLPMTISTAIAVEVE
jgi:hypothetical protein